MSFPYFSDLLNAVKDIFSLPIVRTIFIICCSLSIIASVLRACCRLMVPSASTRARVHRAELERARSDLDESLVSPWPCLGFICDAKDCPFVGKTKAYCNSCIRLNDCRFCLHGGEDCDRFGKN